MANVGLIRGYHQGSDGIVALDVIPLSGPTLTQSDWYIDPVAGRDDAAGTATAPLKTWAEFMARMGSETLFSNPRSATVASLNLHWLSSQPDDSDPVTMLQALHDVAFTMDGVLVQVGAGTFGAVTNQGRATATLTTGINAGAVPANYWSAFVGMLVHDTTRDVWFRVDADLGAKKAQLSQPFVGAAAVASLPNPEGTIALGDAFIVYDFPHVHVSLEQLRFQSTDSSLAMQFKHLHVVTHVPGGLGMTAQNLISVNAIYFLECTFDGVALLRTYPEQMIGYNCAWLGGLVAEGVTVVGGTIGPFLTMVNGNILDGDVIVHGGSEVWGDENVVAFAYFDGSLDVPFSGVGLPAEGQLTVAAALGAYGGAAVWGPAPLHLHSNGRVMYDGLAAARFQNLGGITIAGLATAAKVTLGPPRSVSDGVPVTVANIDDTGAGTKLAGMLGTTTGRAAIFPFA